MGKKRRVSCPAGASRTGPMARKSAIVYVTPGYQMIALDAKTGVRIQGFGRNGIVDLKQDIDQKLDESGRNRAARDAGHCQGRRDRRRRAPARRVAARPGERQGLRPRLRRAHRQAPVDFPHDPAPGRVRQRHVAERFLVVYRQHRRLGADQRRRGARHGRTCRSRFRRATTTAVIGRATTCSPRAWSRSI